MLDPGTAIQVGSAALNGIKGIATLFGAKSDEEKAREELSRLETPFYKIQNEYIQNRNIAGNMASSGLPDATKNYYTTEAQRGLGSGLNAVMTAGGDPNDVNRLLDVYNQSINRVGMEDAQTRVGNIQNFFNLNKELAGQKTMQWTLNEYAPYERKLKEITNRIAAAKQNQNTGFNDIIGSTSAAGTAISNNDLMNKLFAKKTMNAGNQNSDAPNASRGMEAVGDGSSTNQFDINSTGFTDAEKAEYKKSGNLYADNQSQDIYNPSVNPFAPNGHWDGNQWVP